MLLRLAAAVLAAVGSVSLTPTETMAAHRHSYRAHWLLNEVHGPTAWDASKHHNDGLRHHIVGDGRGYRFNGVDSRVVVPSSASLNPRFDGFSWGVTLRMGKAPSPVGETYDVLRKGLVTTRGGDYKVEVKNVDGRAVARCVTRTFRRNGTKVLAYVQGSTNLANHRRHRVRCTKTSTNITLKVDSLSPRTKRYPGGLGSVSNTSKLALGAKAESTATTGFDWFRGEIFTAWVASS
jgi:hypothetical protein